MDEGQTGDEVKLPRFGREAAMGLGNFSVDTTAVARYLEAVESELRSLFPLVLRLTMEAEIPLAAHLRNPYMPLEIGLAWHPLSNAPYIPATTLKGALRAGRGEALADCRRPICSGTWGRGR
jgi:CRISPR-associated protein Cmr6